jgi:ABC-type transport system substrate-binding protein
MLMTGCAPAPGSSTGDRIQPPSGASSQAGSASRTLNFGVRYELGSVAAKMSAGITSAATKRLFNAALAYVDGEGEPRPYLADSLPQLNTPTWRVFPDGRMETTYTLRPGLTWHDGAPLSAEDFVFGWRVYTAPGMGSFESAPQDRIESVTAPDARTVVVVWRDLYPDAGSIRDGDLDPLPRHILADDLEQNAPDAFLNLPYWSREFVGVGRTSSIAGSRGPRSRGSPSTAMPWAGRRSIALS